jgi:hypothetical protein
VASFADGLEPVRTVVRLPAGTTTIRVEPAFGGEVVIMFYDSGARAVGLPLIAPAGFTYNPDGTITYPDPFATQPRTGGLEP